MRLDNCGDCADIASLLRAGAVGDLLCRFIDEQGEMLDHPLNGRVNSASPSMLRDARRIVLASGGWEKLAPIRATLALIRPQVLITDEDVARSLLDRRCVQPSIRPASAGSSPR